MTLLDLSTFGIQILVPLVLIAWLAFAPLQSRLGFAIQSISSGVYLVAMMLVAVWMIPPWWAPFTYLALWFAGSMWRAHGRMREAEWIPRRWTAWVSSAALLLLGIWSGLAAYQAVQGRQPPASASVVDIAFPMGPGIYLVASGGANATVNRHFLTLHPRTDRQRAYRGQSYAVDLIKLNRWGFRSSGWRPSGPAAYEVFGEPVYAPCSGAVLAASGGMPDMTVPRTDTSRLEGNHVLIDCGRFHALLAHFRLGSVKVAPGDQVDIGQPIGEVGNSGQSTEPHLHIHVQHSAEPGRPLLSGEPLFFTFDGAFAVRNDRIKIED